MKSKKEVIDFCELNLPKKVSSTSGFRKFSQVASAFLHFVLKLSPVCPP